MEKSKTQYYKRTTKAKSILLNDYGLDKILDVYDAGNFVEVVGRKGGDVLTFRVYNNGEICER